MRRDSPIAYVLLYVALYGAFGVASPFWPKLFESKGLTLQEIGWILAAALVVRLTTTGPSPRGGVGTAPHCAAVAGCFL